MKDRKITARLTLATIETQEMRYSNLDTGDIFTWGAGCDYAIKCESGHVMINGSASGEDKYFPESDMNPVVKIAKNPRLVVES